MTRKDYVKFAKMIRARRDWWNNGNNGESPPILAIADDMAKIFASDNPNFNRDRFMSACGIEV